MLLIHHCTVNEDEDHCWSLHLQAVNDLTLRDPTTSSPSLFTAYQAILARTACSLTDDRLPLPHEYHWLGSENSDELERVDGTIGISRAVLYIINSITASSGDEVCPIKTFLVIRLMIRSRQLLPISQTPPLGDPDQNRVLIKTAESYRLAARIYLYCRLLGLVVYPPLFEKS